MEGMTSFACIFCTIIVRPTLRFSVFSRILRSIYVVVICKYVHLHARAHPNIMLLALYLSPCPFYCLPRIFSPRRGCHRPRIRSSPRHRRVVFVFHSPLGCFHDAAVVAADDVAACFSMAHSKNRLLFRCAESSWVAVLLALLGTWIWIFLFLPGYVVMFLRCFRGIPCRVSWSTCLAFSPIIARERQVMRNLRKTYILFKGTQDDNDPMA